ncbi:hypothetical protein L596_005468 [Steinernema carpocapsae]|uniref:F-box domain-containing protein n=1 Tax=Steinernema carpocapsae TaxID=34508 RepID=A0A4U8UZ39_STECR|nr:hypothetical protein L596_005468 [Steinernema carpocapsae]
MDEFSAAVEGLVEEDLRDFMTRSTGWREERSGDNLCRCLGFRKERNGNTVQFRITIAPLPPYFQRLPVGVVLYGAVKRDPDGVRWDIICSASVLHTTGLNSEANNASLRAFYSTLLADDPQPVERFILNPANGTQILSYLQPRDIANLEAVSQRTKHALAHQLYDNDLWKRYLTFEFGESAVAEAERRNITYRKHYLHLKRERREQDLEAQRQARAAFDRLNDPLLADPHIGGGFFPLSRPVGPSLPVRFNPYMPQSGSPFAPRIPPSMRFQHFGGPSGSGGRPDLPDQAGPMNLDDCLRLFGDGYRRGPDFDGPGGSGAGGPFRHGGNDFI